VLRFTSCLFAYYTKGRWSIQSQQTSVLDLYVAEVNSRSIQKEGAVQMMNNATDKKTFLIAVFVLRSQQTGNGKSPGAARHFMFVYCCFGSVVSRLWKLLGTLPPDLLEVFWNDMPTSRQWMIWMSGRRVLTLFCRRCKIGRRGGPPSFRVETPLQQCLTGKP